MQCAVYCCTSLFPQIVRVQFLCISCMSFYDRRVQPIAPQLAWFHRWRFLWEISVLIVPASDSWLQETQRVSRRDAFCLSVLMEKWDATDYSINASDWMMCEREKNLNLQKCLCEQSRWCGWRIVLTKNIICMIQSKSDGWNHVWLCYFPLKIHHTLWRLNELNVILCCVFVSYQIWGEFVFLALEHLFVCHLSKIRFDVSDMDKYSMF